MKLTESQINIICHYTDGYRIDREKLISYLEKHRTIKSEVFGYCTKVSKVFWEDMKQIEIARAEGANGHTIDVRMSRIYARLKKLLEANK